MTPSQDKIQKLAYVAQQYYLEDRKQSDIATELGISRPLVSRMLRRSQRAGGGSGSLFPGRRPHSESAQDRLRQTSSIRDCVLVPDGEDDNATNQSLSQGAVQLCGS
mgnify:CR=1 FL=1